MDKKEFEKLMEDLSAKGLVEFDSQKTGVGLTKKAFGLLYKNLKEFKLKSKKKSDKQEWLDLGVMMTLMETFKKLPKKKLEKYVIIIESIIFADKEFQKMWKK